MPLELIPDDGQDIGQKLELVPDEPPIKRPSRNAPIRQFAAGVTDFVTGIPALAGLVGAGGQALFNTFQNDKSLSTNFSEALNDEGFDATLLNMGTSGRRAVNSFLNIEEPQSRTDQVARLLSSAIPNPLMLGKGAMLAANLATPLVKVVPKAGPTIANQLVNQGTKGALKALVTQPGQFVTKGNIGRLGTQLGLNVAVDQGARALSDDSTLVSGARDELVGGDEKLELIPDDSQQFELVPDTVSLDDSFLELLPDANAELDTLLEAEKNSRDRLLSVLGAGTILAGAAALAWRRRLANTRVLPSEFAPFGQKARPEEFVESFKDYAKGNLVDQSEHLKAVMRDVKDKTGNRVFPDHDIEQLIGQGNVDSIGMATQVIRDGQFGQGTGIKMPSLRDWATTFSELDEGTRKTLFDGMLALREKQQRIRSTIVKLAADDPGNARLNKIANEGTADEALAYIQEERASLIPTGLYRNAFRGAVGTADATPNAELDTMIAAMKSDPALAKMIDDYARITEKTLDYAVAREVMSREVADVWKKHSTLEGATIYIPGIETLEPKLERWYQRLGASMGIGTTKQRELQGMSQWALGVAEEGTGVITPLNPIDAAAEYVYHTIDHVNRSKAEWNFLSRLTGVDDIGNISKNAPRNSIATFIGIDEPGSLKGLREIVHKYNSDPAIRKIFNLNDPVSFLDNEASVMQEVIAVQRNGKKYMFYVPDPMLREVMRFKPRVLSQLNQVGRLFKNVFQATTTRLPFFAPISFGYSTQQAWMNAVGRGAKFTPVDAFKGVWEFASVGIADEVAQAMGRAIRLDTGFAKQFPQAAARIEARMKTVVQNSLLNGIQRESGNLASSIASSEFNPSILDMMKLAAPGYRDGYSGLGRAWRMYSIANKALHEGPALGAMLRQLKDIPNPTPNEIRTAVRAGKTLAGDVRRIGSSDAATVFNAWVPFSGAMIQSWNSIGSALNHAIKNNPTRALGLISMPMIPAIMEAVSNSLMGPEYSDYYWNRFTTEERNNNMIFFIPGLPPERAVLIPVSPEWTLGRGMMIEAVDALTGASQGMHLPSGQAQDNGAHVMAGLVRVLDIPVPPAVQALFAKGGYNLRMGFQYHNEQVQLPISIRELTSGERISGDKGRSRYVDPAVDTETEGILRALFGAVGTAYLATQEAFREGATESLEVGADMGLEQLWTEVKKQSRYTNPLTGKNILRPNANDELADSARSKQAGVKKLTEEFNANFGGGRLLSPEVPMALLGNAVRTVQDPVNRIAFEYLPALKQGIEVYADAIGKIRRQIDSLRSGTRDETNQLMSVAERDDRIDQLNLTIRALNGKQLMMFRQFEDAISDRLSKEFGRDIEFDLSNISPRPNLGAGILLPAPRRPGRELPASELPGK